MKSRNSNFTAKNGISNHSYFLLVPFLASILSCTSLQYGLDAQKISKFSTFDGLGMVKEEFIKQYGLPTSKGLYQTIPGQKVEKLYYTEKIKSFLVTTAFIFENNILKEMERIETKNDLHGIKEQLEDVR